MPLSDTTATTPNNTALNRNTTSDGPTAIDWVALVLMIVGGLNWGLIGLMQFDLVAAIFGVMTPASRIVYGLVGLAALYGLVIAARWIRRT